MNPLVKVGKFNAKSPQRGILLYPKYDSKLISSIRKIKILFYFIKSMILYLKSSIRKIEIYVTFYIQFIVHIHFMHFKYLSPLAESKLILAYLVITATVSLTVIDSPVLKRKPRNTQNAKKC